MAVTILLTFDELPEGQQTSRYTEQQNASLLSLEEAYRTDVAERLPREERDQHAEDSRHFWYNGEFQPHRERTISHIATTATVALNFRRDSYLVSTPRQAEMDRCIDPETPVSEVVSWLHEKKLIGAACCYEVLNARGDVLKPEKSLAEQNALPYTDAKKKQDSLLKVRMQKTIVRNAVIIMFVCAVAGGALGWFIHHHMVQ
jgi:hypothetical protein